MRTISIRKKCLAVFLCIFLTVSIAACQKPSEEEETLKDRDKEISQELELIIAWGFPTQSSLR